MRFLAAAVVVLLVGAGLSGCGGGSAPSATHNTHLYQDLTGTSRDGIYRAVSFIRQAGGPEPAQRPENLEGWTKAREPSIAWLAHQSPDEARRLDADYAQFCRSWIPAFPD